MRDLVRPLMTMALLLVALLHGSFAQKNGGNGCAAGLSKTKEFLEKRWKVEEHKHVILDVDPGVDDIWAMLLSFALDVKIEAITCVRGNTDLKHACENVLRALTFAKRTEIPVYQGCREPLAGRYEPSDDYFGEDGLGGVSSDLPVGNEAKLNTQVHASLQMIKMARESPKKYTLILLGPVTNAALAVTLDPEFTKNLKAIFILGGNYQGRGNVLPGSEFNFQLDPEAADIVLKSAGCPVTVVTWESALNSLIGWTEYDKLTLINTPRGRLFKAATAMHSTKHWRGERIGALAGDALAIMAAVLPATVIKSFQSRVAVELLGNYTRGQMVHAWETYMLSHVTKYTTVVTAFNRTEVYKLFKYMLSC